ncbi:hypothetical protein B4U79_19131, partial [Dinothrombium tinctorium]
MSEMIQPQVILRKLREECNESGDITFTFESSRARIKCHKTLLAAASKRLETMLFNQNYDSDLVIEYKNILILTQKLIAKICFPGIKLPNENEVEEFAVSGFSSKAMQRMIDFVYTGFIDLMQLERRDLFELNELAKHYEIQELAETVNETIRNIEEEEFRRMKKKIERIERKFLTAS